MATDPPETLERFRAYRRTGDPAIRNGLIEDHLDLARREAMRFSGRGEPVDDLVQVARIGVLKAVERFDPDRGVPFGAFARPTVAGELRRHFRDSTWAVHVPRRTKDLHAALGPAASALAVHLGRQPRADELATAVSATVDEVLDALDVRSAYRPTSFSARVDDDGGSIDPPASEDHDEIEEAVDSMVVRELMAELDPRSRTIVYLRYFGRLSQSEIAARIGVSQVHVSRLLRASLDQLRDQMRNVPADGQE
jgi:RNA polymerase sigma-B factor